VHLLDLDTIDLSNLNRQFLFQKQHIKKSKALVAKETASRFNPKVKLEAYHANIKDATYNIAWFKQFTLVFNALDNIDARRHVNKMCLAANIPLIESGTTGFRGQVQVIVRGKTECYDCHPKEVPKSFPICTIRSTPSQPIHCIVWAKSYLFSQIFGVDEDEGALDTSANTDNSEELANLAKEANALMQIRDAIGQPSFKQLVFDKVFNEDIERLRSMEEMWQTRSKPDALSYEDVNGRAQALGGDLPSNDQSLWTLEENLLVFNDSLDRLSRRLLKLKAEAAEDAPTPMLIFDKDDVDTLDFVAAAANIRAHIFGIDKKTKFDIKQMAGNIIAAIATTNAIIAGVCVLQSFKVLKQEIKQAKTVFMSRRPERVFNNETVAAPMLDCQVCGVARAQLRCDATKHTLQGVKVLLQSSCGYSEEFSILTDNLIYDPDFDDNLGKTLADLNAGDGTFLTVVDEDEEDDAGPRVNLVLAIQHVADQPAVELDSQPQITRRPKKTVTEGDHIVAAAPEVNGTGEKRKRSADDDLGSKRKKVEQEVLYINDGDEIEID
jgi:ubiquitin-like 1-activating enzyme E1 B